MPKIIEPTPLSVKISSNKALSTRPSMMCTAFTPLLAAWKAYPKPPPLYAAGSWGPAAADELPGMAHGSGLTFVTWLMRLGFFAGPPLIGIVGDTVSLRWALIVVPITALIALALTLPLLSTGQAAAFVVVALVGALVLWRWDA